MVWIFPRSGTREGKYGSERYGQNEESGIWRGIRGIWGWIIEVVGDYTQKKELNFSNI